jgi:dolichol-phosphate mannosyltransferase
MSLSIIIPARNEELNIVKSINSLRRILKNSINYLVIDDFSTDSTYEAVKNIKTKNILVHKNHSKGLGGAINLGIKKAKKEYIVFFMADSSDSPKDLLKYYCSIRASGVDAIFGSRFIKGSKVVDYPKFKLLLNRSANNAIKFFTNYDCNDFTNAFKIYRRSKLNQIIIESSSFSIFLEIPLKFLLKKFSFSVMPISWHNRDRGHSNFKINELTFEYIKIFFRFLLARIKI